MLCRKSMTLVRLVVEWAGVIAGPGSEARCVRARTTRPTDSHHRRRGLRHSGTEQGATGGEPGHPMPRSAPHPPRRGGATTMRPRGSRLQPPSPARPRARTASSPLHARTNAPPQPCQPTSPRRPHRPSTAIASRWWCGGGPPPPCTRRLPRRRPKGTQGSSQRHPPEGGGRAARLPATPQGER